MKKYNILSWNVNSIRALVKKFSLSDYLEKKNTQILCLSETKLSHPTEAEEKKLVDLVPGFKYRYYNTCNCKKGYSGTAIWSKKKPLNVIFGIGVDELDLEGRVTTLEFDKFYLINVYTPNSGELLARLDYRVKKWDPAFRKFLEKLQKKKPIVVTGDLNCAHKEIDIHSPKTNLKSAGFTIEERNSFTKLLDKLKLIDTFRHFNPELKNVYSYWSYRGRARLKNKGWRIDYFLVSSNIIKNVLKSSIDDKQMGSDHAPVLLTIKI